MIFARTIVLSLAVAAGAGERLFVWTLHDGVVDAPVGAATAPLPVGSIQKLWVAKAWAESHPAAASEATSPRFTCSSRSGCWLAGGHGEVGLRRAISVSCNAYFLALARETPSGAVERALRAAGFVVPRAVGPEQAIGLDSGSSVAVAPEALLRSVHRLVTVPWSTRDDVREALLAGMRDASETGTAAASPLRGILMKTGTVASVDGRSLLTSGWVVAADPTAGAVHLALLRNGTGSQAAVRLGEWWAARRTGRVEDLPLAPPRPSAAAPGIARRGHDRALPGRLSSRPLPASVRVRLFSALSPTRVTAVNVGTAPALGGEGWIGPGGGVELRPGSRLGDGLWALAIEPYGLVRVFRGSVERARRGVAATTLTTPLRDWVEGVLRSEAPGFSPSRRREFVPVVLRFLASGPRHGDSDVCDLTHCAHFTGYGPDVAWPNPRRAVVSARSVASAASITSMATTATAALPLPFEPATAVDDALWESSLFAAAEPGPSSWSGHCGGEPLSEREVWGRGSSEKWVCPRHARGAWASWSKSFPAALLEKALGRKVISVEAVDVGGTRKTRVISKEGTMDLLFDDLHRRLAAVAGWDSLPSPPDAWHADPSGWTATGRGSGHRVGYCLAE